MSFAQSFVCHIWWRERGGGYGFMKYDFCVQKAMLFGPAKQLAWFWHRQCLHSLSFSRPGLTYLGQTSNFVNMSCMIKQAIVNKYQTYVKALSVPQVFSKLFYLNYKKDKKFFFVFPFFHQRSTQVKSVCLQGVTFKYGSGQVLCKKLTYEKLTMWCPLYTYNCQYRLFTLTFLKELKFAGGLQQLQQIETVCHSLHCKAIRTNCLEILFVHEDQKENPSITFYTSLFLFSPPPCFPLPLKRGIFCQPL